MQTAAALIETSPRYLRNIEREYLAGGRVKGSVLRAHVAWVHQRATPAQLKALEAELTSDARPILSSVVMSTSWYPLSWLVDLSRAAVDIVGDGERPVLREAGRTSARMNLDTIFRGFERNDLHTFFRFSALLHTQFQDFGSATYEKLGPSHGRMHHRHYRCFSPYYCESAIGYYEECARLHGGSGVSVGEISCQCLDEPTCTFDIRWE